MKYLLKTAVLLLVVSILAAPAGAAPLKKLAKKLQKGVKDHPQIKVAVLDFAYHDGARSSGSSIVQERLTTYLAQSKKIEVIERKLLKKILEEMKLESTGIIDPDTTRKLGKLLGVGALVTGTLNDLSDKKTEVNARIIQTETGKILAAGRTVVKRTWTDSPVKPGQTPPTPPDQDPAAQAGQGKFLGKSLVQIALLLDTSNSMDGLINQARSQLWEIVNELSSSEKGGGNPTIEVGVYEYGNSSLESSQGYTRQVIGFSTDLDMVSEQLFSLTTNGGQEYCGYVIKEAVNNLKWDKHDDVYKTIFIAGNEPFTQGPVDFRTATALASKKGIFMNTIYCGRRQEGIATQWKAGADLSQGEYTNIDQFAPIVRIRAPQDDEIARLGRDLNKTYIAYGSRGRKSLARQKKMDSSAASAGGSIMAERAVAKTSLQYSHAAWDVVGALESGQLKEEELKKDQLPEKMRSMSKKERSEYIREKREERKRIQKNINALNTERQKYIKEKEKTAKPGTGGLNQAIIGAIRQQAQKKGFIFKK